VIGPPELLPRVAGWLDAAAIPYMLVGSLASSFHAEPRATRDIDIVIDPTPETLETLLAAIPAAEFYLDADEARRALAQRRAFNIIEQGSGWKVDLLIRRDRSFSREELARRTRVSLGETALYVATAEDTIIAKLEWARAGGSERQLRDVASILAVNGDSLDRAYLDRWIEALGIGDMWDAARSMLPEG
jgi:hypothetical protein